MYIHYCGDLLRALYSFLSADVDKSVWVLIRRWTNDIFLHQTKCPTFENLNTTQN